MTETAPPTSVRSPEGMILPPAPTRSCLTGLVRTARPHQWVKNVLVFAAPGAAGVLTQGPVFGRACLAFAVFSMAASGTYFLNDVADCAVDRGHPTKCRRPIAAGAVPERLALGIAALLLVASILIGWLTLGGPFAACIAGYVGINIAYNLKLRQEAVLDLAAVASGFVLRAVAGGLATGVHLSEWFLVVTSFASLFVVAGKRTGTRVEVSDAQQAQEPRAVYSTPYLRYVRALGSGVAIAAYCLWAFEKSTAAGTGGVWFQWTVIPFVLAMLRYALLVERYEGESPEDLLLRDRTTLVLVAAWVLLFAIAVYGS